MSFVAVDKRINNNEFIHDIKPKRVMDGKPRYHHWQSESTMIWIPNGTIEKIIGHKLTWEDEPVELT